MCSTCRCTWHHLLKYVAIIINIIISVKNNPSRSWHNFFSKCTLDSTLQVYYCQGVQNSCPITKNFISIEAKKLLYMAIYVLLVVLFLFVAALFNPRYFVVGKDTMLSNKSNYTRHSTMISRR